VAALPARRREALTGYAFIAPNLLLFAAFMFLPLVLVFVQSTQESSGFGPSEYVGFGNYSELLRDDVFWRALINTFGFAIVSLPLALGVGLGMALLLNAALPGRALFRAIYFIPTVISAAAAGVVARWIFNENVGIANKAIGLVGLDPVSWQSSSFWAVLSVVTTTLWARVGVYMVVFLAALQAIPRESYEASETDGASRWQQFKWITLPGLKAATAFLVVYGIIESFQVFDLIYVMTKGGPGNATEVLGTYAYAEAFASRERGMGAAIGVVLYLILMVMTLALWWSNRRQAQEETA
jgi:multiple sugar transport system permease protein